MLINSSVRILLQRVSNNQVVYFNTLLYAKYKIHFVNYTSVNLWEEKTKSRPTYGVLIRNFFEKQARQNKLSIITEI